MYYGFFLFLLYMTAPLWVFLPVAVGSWWALRASFFLQRRMRMPIGKFTSRGEIALEPRGRLKSRAPGAWVERRKFNRVAASLKVTYQVLENGWPKGISSSFSGHPAVDSLRHLAKRFKPGKAVLLDISEGGLCIMGKDSFTAGDQLLLSLRLPRAAAPIALLAEVRSSRASFKPGETLYKAGLQIVDVDLENMVQLMDYLFAERSLPEDQQAVLSF